MNPMHPLFTWAAVLFMGVYPWFYVIVRESAVASNDWLTIACFVAGHAAAAFLLGIILGYFAYYQTLEWRMNRRTRRARREYGTPAGPEGRDREAAWGWALVLLAAILILIVIVPTLLLWVVWRYLF